MITILPTTQHILLVWSSQQLICKVAVSSQLNGQVVSHPQWERVWLHKPRFLGLAEALKPCNCKCKNVNWKMNLIIVRRTVAGAHNDVRAEGKGRSVQWPRKRLKFENVLTVVPLLLLACTWTCTNTCTETSQRTRKSTRTLFALKQRKETVTDLEKCCTTM